MLHTKVGHILERRDAAVFFVDTVNIRESIAKAFRQVI